MSTKTYDHTYKLDRLLRNARVPLSLAQIAQALGVAENTAHRIITHLRDTLDAPIEHSREHPAGYRYTDKSYELPGIWFSPAEMQSLLLVLTLLEAFDPGLLAAGFAPLRKKLGNFLRKLGMTADTRGRIRLLRVAACPPGPAFEPVATAVLQRKRMSIRYKARGTSEVSYRQISPQRLTHYRDKWYLDAWCHSRNELRIFSVDCIDQPEVHEERAIDIPAPKLDRKLGTSYGIFSGAPTAWAQLRFTPDRARWVGPEIWHPDQKSWTEPTGPCARIRENLGHLATGSGMAYGTRAGRPRASKNGSWFQSSFASTPYFGKKTRNPSSTTRSSAAISSSPP